ncbi:MAG: hypothetical protein KY452_06080 [Actinobacteria bacterium]|nr:hypothetical protein [Actinomycetota bacterium]
MAGENEFPPATPERPSVPPTEPRPPPTELAAAPSADTDLAGLAGLEGARRGFREWPYWLQALAWAVAGAVVAASLTSALGTELAAERPSTTRVVYQCADGETRDTPCPGPSTTRDPITTTEPPPPPPATTPAPSGPATTIPPGIYAVGEDILPGRYRSAGGSFCYWATLRGRSGEFDEIIANDISEGGAQIVEIGEEVAYFETNGCATWVRD